MHVQCMHTMTLDVHYNLIMGADVIDMSLMSQFAVNLMLVNS